MVPGWHRYHLAVGGGLLRLLLLLRSSVTGEAEPRRSRLLPGSHCWTLGVQIVQAAPGLQLTGPCSSGSSYAVARGMLAVLGLARLASTSS